MKLLKIIGHIIFILVLTTITQIGGIIWCLALFISYKTQKKKRLIFPILYLIFNLLLIPPLARYFGRVKLPIINKPLKPKNWMYPLLFRNYVTPELNKVLKTASKTLEKDGITITYLDANFPFIDRFPLLPHLSHNDGKKIDICFMYKDKKGHKTDKKPSVSGYGAYINNTSNTTSRCIKQGYWQYDFTKYLTFGSFNNLTFDSKNTKKIINQFLASSKTDKIFIEPYLKQGLGLSNKNKIRFHGCQAVRHDDHIHIQIK